MKYFKLCDTFLNILGSGMTSENSKYFIGEIKDIYFNINYPNNSFSPYNEKIKCMEETELFDKKLAFCYKKIDEIYKGKKTLIVGKENFTIPKEPTNKLNENTKFYGEFLESEEDGKFEGYDSKEYKRKKALFFRFEDKEKYQNFLQDYQYSNEIQEFLAVKGNIFYIYVKLAQKVKKTTFENYKQFYYEDNFPGHFRKTKEFIQTKGEVLFFRKNGNENNN